MMRARFRFLVADQIVEADFYRLQPDEVDLLPGDRKQYSMGKVGRSIWAASILGRLDALVEGQPARKVGTP